MNNTNGLQDIQNVLDGLKDFQLDTVDYVFKRMYLDKNPTKRFLIADEVGLGKTLVARGLIARAIQHLWDKKPDLRIDVVYICSNVQIARQNINRLNITGKKDFALASRITLLPTQVNDLSKHKLNFVSFTPGTSFDLRSSMGIVRERALLYELMDQAWGISSWGKGPLNVLQGDAGKGKFRDFVYSQKVTSDELLANSFTSQLKKRNDLKKRFQNLCSRFHRSKLNIPEEDRKDRSKLVGELRSLLAKTCLNSLEPDIIILDEFQRFKHLLDGDDETSLLARELFNFSNEDAEARVILLSATPYKMYTMQHEEVDDDHYKDFLRTVEFLLNDGAEAEAVKHLLSDYRNELFRIKENGVDKLRFLKSEIESHLKKVMIRTERLSVTPNRDGMLKESACAAAKLEPKDIKAYISLQKIARTIEADNTAEYWKSSPYLLNFMDEYEFKRRFKEALSKPDQRISIAKEIGASDGLVVLHSDIEGYKKIDPNNTKLKWLHSEMIESGAWKLLWIPPSLPYYKPSGVFGNDRLQNLTKRLIFSSWRVVPKAIATVLSYEAERNMICSYQRTAVNTADARKRRKPLLKFTKSKGRLSGMPVLGMLYPCSTMAIKCDPLKMSENRGSVCDVSTIHTKIKSVINTLLDKLPPGNPSASTGEDEAWYWAAPILMDLHQSKMATKEWFCDSNLSEQWGSSGEEEENTELEEDEENSRWSDHVKNAVEMINGSVELGKRPADLSDVLATMAIAGPGIVALRALKRVTDGNDVCHDKNVKLSAAKTAWAFRTLFNTPETTALLRSIDNEKPYWQVVLDYCMCGNIQAVMDEYVHVLHDSLGLLNKPDRDTAKEISDAVCSAMLLRTSSLSVDFIELSDSSRSFKIDHHRMRVKYALRFGEEKSEDGKEVTRADQVREAFNSPFWPFVMATTSIGQEGLDFHPYCHAIVHWNLPSNPVDLEQREGRIHRYKGHAVRKNIARGYGTNALDVNNNDPWQSLFSKATSERDVGVNDLIPYWIFPVEEGCHIERYVPSLPLSRDVVQMDALRRSQAVYRMVFGQARQDDLIAYLLSNFSEMEISEISSELLINLSPEALKEPI